MLVLLQVKGDGDMRLKVCVRVQKSKVNTNFSLTIGISHQKGLHFYILSLSKPQNCCIICCSKNKDQKNKNHIMKSGMFDDCAFFRNCGSI